MTARRTASLRDFVELIDHDYAIIFRQFHTFFLDLLFIQKFVSLLIIQTFASLLDS